MKKSGIFFGILLSIVLVVAVVLNFEAGKSQTGLSSDSIVIDNGDLKINWERYKTVDLELSDSVTIQDPGTYKLTGEISDGLIKINAGDSGKVRLILDNVTIKNSDGPAIMCNSADDLVIELSGENTLEDSSNYASVYDEDVTGTIYSKADLTFTGDGTLSLKANFQDGIVSKDDLKFNSGTYIIASADDAIRGRDSVYIVDGKFTISSTGDAIKSTNTEDNGKGFVLIEGGDISISSQDDGIHAERELIIKDGKIKINKSYEGIEARAISLNGGDIDIYSSDDGINAGGGSSANNSMNPFDTDAECIVTINNSSIKVNAGGDGIDSNGYIHINGGKVIVDGPSNNGNGALDAGIEIIMNGGEVIAIGASGMAESLGSSSSINSISVFLTSFEKAGTLIEIKDENEKTIYSHTSAKSFNHIAFGSEKLVKDKTYSLYLNGEKYEQFTIKETVTTVGNASNMNQGMPGAGTKPDGNMRGPGF